MHEGDEYVSGRREADVGGLGTKGRKVHVVGVKRVRRCMRLGFERQT